ncbi:hypothetical protein PIB30_105340, partial [Stylosanthes scabra]|nr:hypothetical protein [Stylosanthes scabra]
MRVWIFAQDARIWEIVESGDQISTKKETKKVGDKDIESIVPKPKDEWSDDDWKKISLNNKTINFLHCALNPSDYMKISACTSAKE